MTLDEEWVVWNGTMGILDMVRIGRVEESADGRQGFLAPPYAVVGPFSMDELEGNGRITFGECLVMSRARWQSDQVELRLEAQRKRRAYLIRAGLVEDDSEHREALDLPLDAVLTATEINAAFRRRAKSAHPDAGGTDEDYRRIAEARDALLEQFAGVS